MRKSRSPSRPRKAAQLDAAGARSRALKLLSQREHSAAELRAKLQRRGADAELAGDAVQGMTADGWQSDARYAEMLLRNRVEQGYGPLRVRAELTHAGIAEGTVRSLLVEADIDWTARCLQLARRRFAAAPGNAASWQKCFRYLASRGFSSQQVRAALKSLGMAASSGDQFEADGEFD